MLQNYLAQFEKIHKGLNHKNKKSKKEPSGDGTNNRKSNLDVIFKSYDGNKSHIPEDEDSKRRTKEEEVEDGCSFNFTSQEEKSKRTTLRKAGKQKILFKIL